MCPSILLLWMLGRHMSLFWYTCGGWEGRRTRRCGFCRHSFGFEMIRNWYDRWNAMSTRPPFAPRSWFRSMTCIPTFRGEEALVAT